MFKEPKIATKEIQVEFLNRPHVVRFGADLGYEMGYIAGQLVKSREPYGFDDFYAVLTNIPSPVNISKETVGLFFSIIPFKKTFTRDSETYKQLALAIPKRAIYLCDFPEEKSYTLWFRDMGSTEDNREIVTTASYNYTNTPQRPAPGNTQSSKDAFAWMYKGVLPA